MDWTATVDAYCERTSPDFWAEPLNALTNLAFVVAALAAARLAAKRGGGAGAWALVVVLLAIGVGSFLFHTVATRWAGLADVLPITIFIHLYLYLALRRFVGLPVWGALLGVVGFLAGSAALGRVAPPGALNGSVSYLPALMAMLVVGGILLARRHAAASGILLAAVVFLASLTARSLDEAVCQAVPVGLHFIWHLLNATVLYLLLRTLVIHGRPGGAR